MLDYSLDRVGFKPLTLTKEYSMSEYLSSPQEIIEYIHNYLAKLCSNIEVSHATINGQPKTLLYNAPSTVFIHFEFFYDNKEDQLLDAVHDALSSFSYGISDCDYIVKASCSGIHMYNTTHVELVVQLSFVTNDDDVLLVQPVKQAS